MIPKAKKRNSKRTTFANVPKLLALWQDPTLSMTSIAAMLCMSYRGVEETSRRLGLPPRPPIENDGIGKPPPGPLLIRARAATLRRHWTADRRDEATTMFAHTAPRRGESGEEE